MSFLNLFNFQPRLRKKFSTGPKKISAHLLNNLSTTSGIARFRITPSSKVSDGDVLVVSIDNPDVPPVRFDRLAGGHFQIGVHTHFLPNGKQPVTFTLLEGERKIFQGEVRIDVNHQGRLAESVGRIFHEKKTPLAFLGKCDAAIYPYDADESVPWFDRPDAEAHIGRLLQDKAIDAYEAERLREFVRDGYMVLEDLIDPDLISRVNREIDGAIASRYQGYEKGSSQRIEHLHKRRRNICKLWLDKRHLRFADLIFNGRARPCQTLVFVCGSEQDVHSDVIHLTPFPAGYMCGIWIALQDVVPDSGELVVYPGTHRRKRIYMGDAGAAKVVNGDWTQFGEKVSPLYADAVRDIKPVVYRPKKGSVLIWHENLLHGGSARRNPTLERRSMVIHAFADGAVVYYDSTGDIGTVAPRGLLTEPSA